MAECPIYLPAPTHSCPACGHGGNLTGHFGNLAHFRCRACGVNYSRAVNPVDDTFDDLYTDVGGEG